MLKNTQLVSEEISADMASAKEELDAAVPFHTLLDVSANRSRAELAHKGTFLSQRQRPSQEALRATVLRKSVSTLSNASDSGFPVSLIITVVENDFKKSHFTTYLNFRAKIKVKICQYLNQNRHYFWPS